MRCAERLGGFIIAVLVMAAPAAAQPAAAQPAAPAPAPAAETIDVFDLWRKVRHKEAEAQAQPFDYRKKMIAFAPVIGAKPSAGVLLGAAGNVAVLSRRSRDDPHLVARRQHDVLDQEQTALTDRFTMFGAGRPLAPRSGSSVPVDVPRDPRTGRERGYPRRHARRFRFLSPPPHRVLPAAAGALRGRGPVLRQPHRHRPARRGGGGVDRVRLRQIQRSARLSTRVAGRRRHEFRSALGQPRQLHQRGSRLDGQDQLSNVVRRFPRRGLELAEAHPRCAQLREPLTRSPAQARFLGLHRPGDRGRGAFPGSALHGGRHLWPLGPRLRRRPVPRRTARLR